MATAGRRRPVTFEEFCRISTGEEKADLIDGVIYVATLDTPAINELTGLFFVLLSGYVEHKDLGTVFLHRVAYRLDDLNGPEPDIGFVRKGRQLAIKREYVQGPPDLAAEIVIPESVELDYDRKRKLYEQFGVREYWIVDDLEKKVTLLRRRQGSLRQVRARKGVLASSVVPGFWLRPEWLWQSPEPCFLTPLRKIFKGRPGR